MQLWGDVFLILDLVVRGLDTDSEGFPNVMDGFEKVDERVVEAAVANVFGFSAADTDILRDGFLAAAISDARMVKACYMGTWAFVQSKRDNDQVTN